jgi:hypothetical protein
MLDLETLGSRPIMLNFSLDVVWNLRNQLSIRVEAPITDHWRDFTPHLEKGKVVKKKISCKKDKSREDCNFTSFLELMSRITNV